MNRLTFLAQRSGEWRLLRQASPKLMLAMEEAGWWIRATWLDVPSVTQVLVAARLAS